MVSQRREVGKIALFSTNSSIYWGEVDSDRYISSLRKANLLKMCIHTILSLCYALNYLDYLPKVWNGS